LESYRSKEREAALIFLISEPARPHLKQSFARFWIRLHSSGFFSNPEEVTKHFWVYRYLDYLCLVSIDTWFGNRFVVVSKSVLAVGRLAASYEYQRLLSQSRCGRK
jgi:hypothetical protein